MKIEIENTLALEGGDVSVSLALCSAENVEKKTFIISPEDWRGLRPKNGRELNTADYDALEAAAAFHSALQKGLGLLSYGANSHDAIERKLIRRGVDAKTALLAADYLGTHGYINESSDADSIIQQCLAKGYGKRRIILKLRERGYGGRVLSEAEEKLSNVDFAENCAGVIRKRCGRIPPDRESRDRIVAAMIRYGYCFSEIRDAVRLLENEESEKSQ